MSFSLTLSLSALITLISCAWIYYKILKIAKTKNITDKPNARKLQITPVPVLGGVAVYFGLLVGLLAAGAMFSLVGFDYSSTQNYTAWSSSRGMLLPVIISATLMMYIGATDDTIGLSAFSRIVVEALTILGLSLSSGLCVDSFHGLWGINDFSWYIGLPLTVFAGVGIINAFNMVDGVNGLSSGLCITVSILMGTFFYKRFDWTDAVLFYCFATALIPFLFHNAFGKNSRMFIGDAGTMMMGLLVTWSLIKTLSSNGAVGVMNNGKPEVMCLPAMLLAVASVPVMDTIRVMTSRIIHGKSPFKPDKTHLHHAFVGVGVSHSITTLSEIIINLTIVGAWYLSYKVGLSLDAQLHITVASSVILIWGTYFFLRHQLVHETKLLPILKKINIKTHFGSKKWWLRIQNLVDYGSYSLDDDPTGKDIE